MQSRVTNALSKQQTQSTCKQYQSPHLEHQQASTWTKISETGVQVGEVKSGQESARSSSRSDAPRSSSFRQALDGNEQDCALQPVSGQVTDQLAANQSLSAKLVEQIVGT